MTVALFLCAISFLAGFVDAIAGGGGLIQLPALLLCLPQVPVATVLGTNKLAAFAGTAVAAGRYAAQVDLHWRATLPAAVAACLCSFAGARVVTLLRPELLRPAIFVLLIVIALYTFLKKDFGLHHLPRLTTRQQWLFGIAAGAVIGFYDGIFGPGTGTFLMVVFVSVFGFDFLSASASSKVVNAATNFAALLYFAWTGHIIYRFAAPMAACNILGSLLGTRLAIMKGSALVRVLFLLVTLAMIVKFGCDLFLPR